MASNRFWFLVGVAAIVVAGWRMNGGIPSGLSLKRGAAARINTISTGERVEIVNHVAPSGRTIIEFTAEW